MTDNKYLNNIIKNALKKPVNLILPEKNDSRVIKAKEKLSKFGFNVLDIDNFSEDDLYFDCLKNKKFTNNWTDAMILDYLSEPLNKGLVLLDLNIADCLVAGAVNSTSNVIKSTLRIIGLQNSTKWVSSSFFLVSSDCKTAYTYSDCGVIPDPDSEQLVSIAHKASILHQSITGEESRVAFLSFSSHGSADHYRVKRVQDAVKIFGKKISTYFT